MSNDIVEGRLLIGISNSITAIMDTDSTELLKYCPVGLTGSNPSSNSIICNEITQDKGKQFLLHRFLLFFFYEFLASQVVAYVPPAWENTHTHTQNKINDIKPNNDYDKQKAFMTYTGTKMGPDLGS